MLSFYLLPTAQQHSMLDIITLKNQEEGAVVLPAVAVVVAVSSKY